MRINEDSALLNDDRFSDSDEDVEAGRPNNFDEWRGEDETKSTWYLILLTLSIGGLQIVWSVELSNGSPYLLSLGMSKSLLAFVWIAGPLSGVLVQPYVGIRSDNCRISWGKRKPFMIVGAAATIVSLLGLAWTREIVKGFLGLFGANPESQGVKVSAILFAIVLMYILDFSINTSKLPYIFFYLRSYTILSSIQSKLLFVPSFLMEPQHTNKKKPTPGQAA